MLPAHEAVSQPSLPSQVKCVPVSMFEPTHLTRSGTLPFEDGLDCASLASTPIKSTVTSPSLCSQSNIDDMSPHITPAMSASAAAHPPIIMSFDLVNSATECIGAFLEHNLTIVPCSFTKCSFDALCEPKIPIAAYFSRIRQYSQASPESIVCALVLMRKIYLKHFVLTNFNVHRLLIASVMVFAKYYDDETDSNSRWARIAGLKKCEVNNLEVEFLNYCHFDLRVSSGAFHDMVMELTHFRANPPSPSDSRQSCSSLSAPCPAKKTKTSMRIFHSRHPNTESHSPENTKPEMTRTHTTGNPVEKPAMTVFHTAQQPLSRVPCSSNDNDGFHAPSVPVTPVDCTKKKLPRPSSMQSIAGLLQKSPSIFKKKNKQQNDHQQEQQQQQQQQAHQEPTH